jgi:hypothetical protein
MGSDSVAARVRGKVLASRNRFWRPEEFSDYSASAVARSLSRLAQSGEHVVYIGVSTGGGL